uniref:DNA-directed RNA polymerase III subunit RPC5 C-terminal domain-containing protein n=1 Tax=Arion vulgaris TaxID=1028688 RepID=A0A0B6ZKL5_9EUPU
MNQQPTERHRSRKLSSWSPRKRTLSGRSQSDVSDVELDHSDKQKIIDSSACRNILDMDSTVNGNIYPSNNLQNGVCVPHTGNMNTPSANSEHTDNPVLIHELEKFMKEVLSESTSICMSDLRSKLSMYTARVPSAHVFSSGVSDKMIEDAVVAVGGFRLKNQWPSNRKPELMFSSLLVIMELISYARFCSPYLKNLPNFAVGHFVLELKMSALNFQKQN